MNKYIVLFSFVLTNIFGPVLYGQTNNDSLFSAAIGQAHNKNYSEALTNCRLVLSTDPGRTDVITFMANVYAWQGKYSEALETVSKTLAVKPADKEANAVWLNILLWNQDYTGLLTASEAAQHNGYSDPYDLLVKRILAHKGLEEYPEALVLIRAPENSSYRDTELIVSLYNEILMLSKTKSLAVFYALDFFTEYRPQHLAFVEFSMKIKKHTLVFRSNYAHRFQLDGLQLESDFYARLRKNMYLYLNYGYAFGNLFPQHRAGVEYYVSFARIYEASLGARYLQFPNDPVFIATGSISVAPGKNVIALRPFYVIKESGNSVSLLANYKIYGRKQLNYWGAELSYGNSPDDRYTLIQNNEIYHLKSYKLKLEKNVMMGKTSDIRIGAGYAYEEYTSGLFRNRFLVELQYKIRL